MVVRMFGLTLIAVWLLIASPVQAQEQPRGVKLTNADLLNLFVPGLIMDGTNVFIGVKYTTWFESGGNANNRWLQAGGMGGMSGYFSLEWRIVGDTQCATYPPNAGYGPGEVCFTHYRLSDGSYEGWVEGKLHSIWRVRDPK